MQIYYFSIVSMHTYKRVENNQLIIIGISLIVVDC